MHIPIIYIFGEWEVAFSWIFFALCLLVAAMNFGSAGAHADDDEFRDAVRRDRRAGFLCLGAAIFSLIVAWIPLILFAIWAVEKFWELDILGSIWRGIRGK